MRTTLTLDSDVARLAVAAAHREGRPMTRVINDVLRRTLAPDRPPAAPYRLNPHESAVRSGSDLAGFNRLSDRPDHEFVTGRPGPVA